MDVQNVDNQAPSSDASPAPDAVVPSRLQWRRRAIAVLAVLALIGAGATLASTTVQETADNVMTFGDVKLQALILAPSSDPAEEGEYEDVSEEPLEAPFGKTDRHVAFKNTGSHPVFVRARVGVNAVRKGAGAAGETEVEPWSQATFDLQVTGGDMPAADDPGAAGAWFAGTGEQAGWYYYGKILKPGETTEPLITSVDLEDYNTMVTQGWHFELDVLGQGVQSENQRAPEGGVLNALTAVGWPEDEEAGAAAGQNDEGQEW